MFLIATTMIAFGVLGALLGVIVEYVNGDWGLEGAVHDSYNNILDTEFSPVENLEERIMNSETLDSNGKITPTNVYYIHDADGNGIRLFDAIKTWELEEGGDFDKPGLLS